MCVQRTVTPTVFHWSRHCNVANRSCCVRALVPTRVTERRYPFRQDSTNTHQSLFIKVIPLGSSQRWEHCKHKHDCTAWHRLQQQQQLSSNHGRHVDACYACVVILSRKGGNGLSESENKLKPTPAPQCVETPTVTVIYVMCMSPQ